MFVKTLKYGCPETFALIPQESVQLCHPIGYPDSNCCWDATLSPNGIFYLSLGSEGGSGNYAYLNYYKRETNTIEKCFYTKDHFLPHKRAMPGSKLHSCIDFLPDGRIICCNHNTDKAPSHPRWLPYAFYSHPWESYPGSSIFIYDPKTGAVENCGIPAPKESLYGGVYCEKTNAFYTVGFQRGHIFKYDLTTREATDLGRGIETCSHRLHVGPDNNVYFTSPVGWLCRVLTDTDKLEWTGIRLPEHTGRFSSRYLTTYFNLDEERMLVMAGYANQMYEYNIRTNQLKNYGQLISCGELFEGYGNSYYNFSGDMDKDGVLWYSVTPRLQPPEDDWNRTHPNVAYLLRWDWQNDGTQELMGVLGVPGDVLGIVSDLRIDKEKDLLYAAGSADKENGPPIISMQLEPLRKAAGTFGPAHGCAKAYPMPTEPVPPAPPSYEGASPQYPHEAFDYNDVTQIRIWTLLKDDQENADVMGLYWATNDTVRGICGKEKPKYAFEVRGGEVTALTQLEDLDEITRSEYLTNSVPVIAEIGAKLPHVAGRQYLAVPSATTPWHDGRILCGTKDGMLGLVKGDTVFGLGLTSSSGPVRSLCTNSTKTIAWGVCGDDLDLPHVFRFSDREGLLDLGLMYWRRAGEDKRVAPNILTAIACSPDDKHLVIGSSDRMGSVFIINISN